MTSKLSLMSMMRYDPKGRSDQERSVARLTIRNVDDSTLQWLRERGARRGVSMEQEARDVFAASVGMPTAEGFDRRGFPPVGQEIGDRPGGAIRR
ncbi:FitA-like ribbon-helix-helix domain-containing protein [Mesorhizobium sp. ASY16-5R]|uniref:FitA-like ribbon-helix-helix domain-containing protein n=1 Tax=Mesorhizobium sp. ASY16-5R TaxID=3445772 RepID=UPI003F9F4775